jgi:hypothetical protein
MWVALFLAKPEFEWETASGVLFVIEQLREAALTLAAEIPVNLYGEFGAWLDKQTERWTSVEEMVYEFSVDEAGWDEELIREAVLEPKPGVRLLADRSAEHLGELRPWFGLGAEIGEYHVLLDKCDDRRALPTLEGIVAASGALSQETATTIPVLKKMRRRSHKAPTMSPRCFLTWILESTRLSANETFGPELDPFVLYNLVNDLDNAVQGGLRGFTWHRTNSSHGGTLSLKPQWVKEREGAWVGELRVGNDIARRVRPIAKNVILVLDAFEEEGWARAIYDPLHGDDPQRRHETISSLNDGLNLIRFHGDGTNERIKWDWA